MEFVVPELAGVADPFVQLWGPVGGWLPALFANDGAVFDAALSV